MSEQETTYEESARIARRKAQESIIQEANSDYAEFLAIGAATRENIIAGANKAREIGVRLLSLRAQNRNWEQLTLGMGDPTEQVQRLRFEERDAKMFMRVTERNPEPITDIIAAVRCMKEVLMLQGELPFGQTHGPQKLLSSDPFSPVTRAIMDIQEAWNKNIKEQIPNMTPEKKKACRNLLEPIVKIYEELAA